MQRTWLLGLKQDDLKQTYQEWFSELPEFFRVQFSRCYRIAVKIVVYTSIHTMVDGSLLADVAYVGHKYKDAAREEEEGKQVRALGKKERCKSCQRFPSRAVHSEQRVRASFSGSRVSRSRRSQTSVANGIFNNYSSSQPSTKDSSDA